jgi:hypothetical protein
MSPEEITALFVEAATRFTPITGNPSDDDLTDMREVLTPLLLAIPYDEDGDHNLIGLIEPTTAYTATWHAAFPLPARPPSYDPAIAADATPVVRARREAAHAVKIRDYASFEAAERAVSKFIRDAVDELWYKDLKNARTFYTNVTAKDLLTHLEANCGGLHPVDLINLPTDMMGYYAMADGIPEYIQKLEDAQKKLARAELPMDDRQLLAIASTAVLASQHFPRATDEWEALEPALKTWATWKTTYLAAHIARKRQQLAAGTSEPLARAHAATSDNTTNDTAFSFDKLDHYLDNLANAATTEKTTLAQLIESNSTLTTSLATLSAAYKLLAAGAAGTTLNPPAASQTRNNNRNGHGQRNYAPGGYCWTHGYMVGLRHSSATCKAKALGHKDAASRTNTMNGSIMNKGWETNPTT